MKSLQNGDMEICMNLTAEQLRAVQLDVPVRVQAPEVGSDCVVVRADVYERVCAVLDGALDSGQVRTLVENGMREYDEADPLLDSYQKYRAC
jgi:hypothetical protein